MRPKPLVTTAGSMNTDGRITELHLWAVHEGLRRTPTAILFEDFCRRLVAAGVPNYAFETEPRTDGSEIGVNSS
jgi:hypothetical protein